MSGSGRVLSATTVGVIAALVTELLYGVSFVFTKGAVDVVSPSALLAWRFTTALVVLGALVGMRVVRLTLTRATWKPLLALAICQPLLYYSMETIGVQRTTASESGIVLAMIPVGILLASWLVLGKPPSRRQTIGILITIAGVVATVAAGGVRAGFDPMGYLFLLGALAAYSLYTVFAERDTATTGLDKTFAMIVVGAVVFTLIAVGEALAAGELRELATLPVRHPGVLVSIGYLAVGSSIAAFFLQAVAIRRLGSNRYSSFIGLATLTTVVTAAIVLGERLAPLQLIGGAVILVGVYVANTNAPTRVPQPAP